MCTTKAQTRLCIKEIWRPGYKTSSCSTQLSITFIMLINVKMTIVGILTLILPLRVWKQEKSLSLSILAVMSSWNFMLSWVEHEKKIHNFRACFSIMCTTKAQTSLSIKAISSVSWLFLRSSLCSWALHGFKPGDRLSSDMANFK